MADRISERFRIPTQNFFTPEDATTWAAILRTRYLNDCLDNMLNPDKAPPQQSIEMKAPTNFGQNYNFTVATDPGSSTSSNLIKEDNYVKQIPFSQILYKRQKPSLFGNSIVSLEILGSSNINISPRTKSVIKRTRLNSSSSKTDQNSKRSKHTS